MPLVEIKAFATIIDGENKILKDIVDVLEAFKHSVDGLCRRDATFLTLKRIHHFVFITLFNSNSAYSRNL